MYIHFYIMLMHILHIWGVNLESRTTPDFLMMKNNFLNNDFEVYYERQLELFNTILAPLYK